MNVSDFSSPARFGQQGTSLFTLLNRRAYYLGLNSSFVVHSAYRLVM